VYKSRNEAKRGDEFLMGMRELSKSLDDHAGTIVNVAKDINDIS
jgi:hypothetical protein